MQTIKTILNATAYVTLAAVAGFLFGILCTGLADALGGSAAACDVVGYFTMIVGFLGFLAVRNLDGREFAKLTCDTLAQWMFLAILLG